MSRLECALPREFSVDSTAPAPTPPMTPLSPRAGGSVLALLALLVAPSSCSPPERPAPPPPLVTVTRPVQQDVTEYEIFVGQSLAFR